MNDEIVGIAILSDKSPHDGYEYLFVTCSSPSRKTVQQCAIPIVAEGQPDPGKKGWTYKEVRAGFLDCKPSLKISVPVDFDKPNGEMRETFHNQALWSVKYVRKPIDQCSDTLLELNRELMMQLKDSWGLIEHLTI